MSLTSNSGIRDEVAALKRERIIEAAVELFYERGYENTTLEAVAERLMVSKPFIYAHFTSKAELLAEICSRGIASSLEAIGSTRGLCQSPAEKLALLGQRFVIAVLKSQKHIAIFTREEKNLSPDDFARISDMRREFDAKLRELLNEGIATGEFKIKDAPLAALAIGGMVSWAYVWYRPNGRLSLPELADQMSSLILSLAGVDPNGAREEPQARTSAKRLRRLATKRKP
jgi:AcrR family transcriptional regulator